MAVTGFTYNDAQLQQAVKATRASLISAAVNSVRTWQVAVGHEVVSRQMRRQATTTGLRASRIGPAEYRPARVRGIRASSRFAQSMTNPNAPGAYNKIEVRGNVVIGKKSSTLAVARRGNIALIDVIEYGARVPVERSQAGAFFRLYKIHKDRAYQKMGVIALWQLRSYFIIPARPVLGAAVGAVMPVWRKSAEQQLRKIITNYWQNVGGPPSPTGTATASL